MTNVLNSLGLMEVPNTNAFYKEITNEKAIY